MKDFEMTLGSSSADAATRAAASPHRPGPAEQQSPTVAATKRVLFGRLQTEDAATAVARRLRTAIGLGVLTPGEKLPRELDLAGQLGVTAFSLREALGVLRTEGLILTRVGKNGGSYVAELPAGESLADDELVRRSAAELRDLGDWRATLTTFAAYLAAQRGAVGTGDILTACASELAHAGDAVTARRALGRFHVELAAGAQSMRLTRAELAVHEEFDWLVQVLLTDGDHRVAVADALEVIADAVRVGDGDAAWNAGERMVSYVVTELMRARLRLIAEQHARPRRGGRGRRSDLVGELRSIAEQVTTKLEGIADDVARSMATEPQALELTAEVARSVLPRLGDLDELVHGLGFMAEVGVVADSPYWLEWWQRSADGTFDRDFSHQLDATQDDFYDYSVKGYMVQPRTTGQPSAMGPYIDHGGVDDNIVTVSVPVTVTANDGDRFVGIMAADIRVATLERSVSPWLAGVQGTCVLANADSRVLLSNTVRYNVGDLLPPEAGLDRTDVGCFGWVLARAEDQD